MESIEALHASDNGRSVEEVLPKAAEKDQSTARYLHQIYRKNIQIERLDVSSYDR